MSIKKLTVAAAIAVGIATCSLSSAMAACPCASDPLPVVTGPACPVETPQPKTTCSKCKRAKSDCGCKKHYKTKKNCGCNDEISCDKTAGPSSALCPQTGKPDRAEMKQVYGYPQAVYGTNNYGYWTMSLLTNYIASGIYTWHVYYNGQLYYSENATRNSNLGIRPVIIANKDNLE